MTKKELVEVGVNPDKIILISSPVFTFAFCDGNGDVQMIYNRAVERDLTFEIIKEINDSEITRLCECFRARTLMVHITPKKISFFKTFGDFYNKKYE